METPEEEPAPIAGVKRPLEEEPPAEPPAEQEPPPAEPPAAAEQPTGEAAAQPPPELGAVPTEAAAEDPAAAEAALQGEIGWLRQQNAQLQAQLVQLQQQHAGLTAAAAAAAAAAARPAPAPAPAVRHNQAWTEQQNPENGMVSTRTLFFSFAPFLSHRLSFLLTDLLLELGDRRVDIHAAGRLQPGRGARVGLEQLEPAWRQGAAGRQPLCCAQDAPRRV